MEICHFLVGVVLWGGHLARPVEGGQDAHPTKVRV